MIFIGTSGWNYYDWQRIFYTEKIKSKDWLNFYSKKFPTVEVNYSFYHLPRVQTFKNWFEQTPEEFIFSVKVSRFITHIKRLKRVKGTWDKFINSAQVLDKKLGPILLQFPASFRIEPKELETFLKITKANKRIRRLKLAFEFRHKSCFDEKIYRVLKKYKAALVISHSSRYPLEELITGSFLYIRFHGPDQLFASKYPNKEMKEWAGKIKKWQKKVKEIYIYFNNDFHGYALANAKTLRKYLK